MWVIIWSACTHALPNDTVHAIRDSAIALTAEMSAYLYNTEYDNELREGLTTIGSYVNARCVFRPTRECRFSLGAHGRKNFGDEDFFTDVRPLFRAQYRRGIYAFTLGELMFTRERHFLPDALLREEYTYDPAVEEGIEFFFDGRRVHQDLWIRYAAENTWRHREHISAGNFTRVTVGPVVMSAMAYADHYGGQMCAPLGDPVRWNIAGGAAITVRFDFEGTVNETGAQQYILASYAKDGPESPHDNGWGSLSRVWIGVAGFVCRFGYFQGHDFIAWEGNPLYRLQRPYYNIEVSRKMNLSGGVFLEFGGRLEFAGIDIAEYPGNCENVVWVNMGWSVERYAR